MNPTRYIVRKTYEVAFAAALLWPMGTPRERQARARRFALKVRENSEKHGPFGIAILINAAIVSLMGMTSFYRPKPPKDDVMEATFDAFPKPADKPAGGGGGGGAANIQIAVPPPTTPTTVTPAAITSTAPSALSFDLPSTSPSITGLPSSMGSGQGGTGSGTGTGSGSGNGSGPGSGSGSGGGNGAGIGMGQGPGKGAGSKRISSLKELAGWDLVVLVDHSNMVGDGGGYEGTIVADYGNGGKEISQTKINAKLLPNIVAQRNTILETAVAWDDNLFPKESNWRSGVCPTWTVAYSDLIRASDAVLPAYRNRPNTAIVIGSEFQWQAKESPMAEQKAVKARLLSYGLPIFFVSLGARPDAFIRDIARESGGGYLGYLPADAALRMAADVETVWTYIYTPQGPIYERRQAKTVHSDEIIAPLGESSQEGLSTAESIRRAEEFQAKAN